MLARTTMVMGTVSTVVPMAGGFLADVFGWRAVLVATLVYVAMLVALVARVYKETVPRKNPHAIDPVPLLRNMRVLLNDRQFAGYCFTVAFLLAGMFVFVSGSSHLFITVFSMRPAVFGLVFTAMASSFICGNYLADRLTRRRPLVRVCGGALVVCGTGAVLLVIGALVAPNAATILMPITVVTLGLGVLMPLCFAGAMAPHPQIAGTASSLIGFVQAVGSVISGQAVGMLFDHSARPMALLMALCIAASIVSFLAILGPLVRTRA